MSDAIYAGTLRHVRLVPRRHEVRHRVTLPYIDLDAAEAGHRALGRRRPGIVRLRRADYLPDAAAATVRQSAERHAAAAGIPLQRGPIRLLANLRTFGHCFNPAAFFYCLTEDERDLQAVLVEVTNTPWGERHVYVLHDPGRPAGGVGHGRLGKALHVSPFMAMGQVYRWRASLPGDRLAISFTTEEAGRAVFHASLDLERRALPRTGLTGAALCRPLPSARTLALIYAHAAVLRARGVRTVSHERAEGERGRPARCAAAGGQDMTELTIAQRIGRALILAAAERLSAHGRLVVHENGRTHHIGPDGGAAAEMHILRPDAWTRFATRRGCMESYVDGAWDSPNLVDVFTLAGLSVPRFDAVRGRIAPLRLPWLRLRGGVARNGRVRSRHDIAAHYDVGNDLFIRMLDPTMMYSSAIFPTPGSSLEEASRHKLDVVCEKLDLGPSDHVIEIGSGWGGFAVHAAGTRGCRVTTTTISAAQHRLACERVRAAGLSHLVDVRLDDYRDLDGTYDKLVSIEMIEAVGASHLGTFFRRCSDLLAPHGRMLLQAITVDDRLFEVAKLSRSFVQTYIFPNGCLPSNEVIAREVGQRTDLRTIHQEDLTDDYVLTLRAWRRNLQRRAGELEELGFDERFRRLWNLYLHYAEAGFVLRRTAVSQFVMVKPGHRSRSVRRARLAPLDAVGARS